MNAFNMTCEAVEVTLPDYLDETLEGWVRTSVQAHLGECVRCAGLVRDLRNIQRDAAALPDLISTRDLWTDVEHRIGTPVVSFAPSLAREAPAALSAPAVSAATPIPPIALVVERQAEPRYSEPRYSEPRHVARGHSRWLGAMWMGAAAAALVAVTATTTYLLTVRSSRPAQGSNVAVKPASPKSEAEGGRSSVAPKIPEPAQNPGSLASDPSEAPHPDNAPLPATPAPTGPTVASYSPADPIYEREVVRLETIMTWRKAQLNPATAAIIENNLRIIDAAIAQSKEALRNDPASNMLGDRLTQALDKKVELLRRAAMLSPRT